MVLVAPGNLNTSLTANRRIARQARRGSPYASALGRALEVIESDERKGSSPQAIARLLGRILRSRSPRLRYTPGPVPEQIADRLTRMLPARFVAWAVARYYRVG